MYVSYLEHLASHPDSRTTIDRIDVNGHYSKENCKWSNDVEQGANRTNNRFLTINGETKTFQTWCNQYSLRRGKVGDRIDKLGWTPEEALGIVKHQNRKS